MTTLSQYCDNRKYLQFLLSTHYLIMEYQVWYLATDLERCWSCPEPKPSPPTSENEDGDRIDDGDAAEIENEDGDWSDDGDPAENDDGNVIICWFQNIKISRSYHPP